MNSFARTYTVYTSILLTLTSGCIAKLSNKTRIWFRIVITPLKSESFFLEYDGFQNIINFETFFYKK